MGSREMPPLLPVGRQAQVGPPEADIVCDIVTETFQTQALWLRLFIEPLRASVRAGSGALGEKEEHSSRSS